MSATSITVYRRGLTDTQPLTRQQEKSATRDELIQASLRFVILVATSFQGRGLELDDLIGAGNLGLIQAAERFDPQKNCKFITFAVWWIRQAIQTALHEHNARITAPAYRNQLAGRLIRHKQQLEQKLGRSVRDEVMLEQLCNESPQKVRQYLATCTVHSLDAPIKGDCGREVSLLESSTMAAISTVEDQLQGEETRVHLNRLLNVLTDQERTVLVYRFGLSGGPPEKLHRIGQRLGVSRERIRQVQKAALTKIRRYLAREDQEEQMHELLELTS